MPSRHAHELSNSGSNANEQLPSTVEDNYDTAMAGDNSPEAQEGHVPTGNKPATCGKRTMLSRDQYVGLLQEFEKTPYPDAKTKTAITLKLGLRRDQITSWFHRERKRRGICFPPSDRREMTPIGYASNATSNKPNSYSTDTPTDTCMSAFQHVTTPTQSNTACAQLNSRSNHSGNAPQSLQRLQICKARIFLGNNSDCNFYKTLTDTTYPLIKYLLTTSTSPTVAYRLLESSPTLSILLSDDLQSCSNGTPTGSTECHLTTPTQSSAASELQNSNLTVTTLSNSNLQSSSSCNAHMDDFVRNNIDESIFTDTPTDTVTPGFEKRPTTPTESSVAHELQKTNQTVTTHIPDSSENNSRIVDDFLRDFCSLIDAPTDAVNFTFRYVNTPIQSSAAHGLQNTSLSNDESSFNLYNPGPAYLSTPTHYSPAHDLQFTSNDTAIGGAYSLDAQQHLLEHIPPIQAVQPSNCNKPENNKFQTNISVTGNESSNPAFCDLNTP